MCKKNLFNHPLVKSLLAFVLAVVLVFSNAGNALAARTGGRIGGGSFRAPARTYSPPSRTYAPPGGGGYYPGGGIGFPLVWSPFFFGGGFGGLFTILIFISIAGFLVRSFRQIGGSAEELEYSNPTVSVAKLQIGLLSTARSLQTDLNRLAETADTGTPAGLARVLQETTLALLRHPEYWVYGSADVQQSRLEAAEAQFNRLALSERSKFTQETLFNVNNQLQQATAKGELPGAGALAELEPGEYLVATLIVASQGTLQLPAIHSADDLRRAIAQFGSVGSDRLLALEVLWTPQAEGDTLSAEEMLTVYPRLNRI